MEQDADFHGNPAGVAWNPTSQFLAIGFLDNKVRVFTLDGEQTVEFAGHAGWVVSLDWSRSGRWLATGSQDRTAIVWDVDAQQPRWVAVSLGEYQVESFDFDRIYGAWWGKIIATDAKAAVKRSAERYVRALED